MANRDIIVIGGSAGSGGVLQRIMADLPPDLDASLFVATHVPSQSAGYLADMLSRGSTLPVRTAVDGQPIEKGHVYVAVPDRHLLVIDGTVRLGDGPRENMTRPAIDPLFRSAALSYGPRTVGVVLSGLLNDGASGLRAIKACGGTAIVQHPLDAAEDQMPLAALECVEVDEVAAAADLAKLTFLDVTSTVKAEAALRESEARLRVLLAELQHRVRNTLAVVKSIARRTAQSTNTADEMADHLVGRLDAFARVQSAVARNPDAGIDLASLLADEMLAHAVHEGDTLVMKGPTVLLKPRAAESISLAIHELTTNAVKHGALRDKDGKIAVKWRVSGSDGEKRLLFEWAEQAPNNHFNRDGGDGFGMELLARILPHDLGAKTDIEFRKNGVRFNLELPYEHLMAADGGGATA